MTRDTMRASALSVIGEPQPYLFLSGTRLLQTRPWIPHGIGRKGLILILINLITVKRALMPNCGS